MKAKTLERLTAWSEWIVAGSLAVTTSAFLLAVLTMLGRLQYAEAAQAAAERPRLGDGTATGAAACVLPQAQWPEIEVALAPSVTCTEVPIRDGRLGNVILCRSSALSRPIPATLGSALPQASRERSMPVAACVVLGWLLSLALLAKPSLARCGSGRRYPRRRL